MCFSANASFGASGLLLTAGLFTLSEVKKSSQMMFASIPFLFSLQQLTEGMIWTNLENQGSSNYLILLTKIFLFFALVIWPTWIPFSLILLEKDTRQRKVLYGLGAIGLTFSFVMFYYLSDSYVTAQISGYHIKYLYDLPFANSIRDFPRDNIMENFTGLIYMTVTVIPHFFSSISKIQILGVVTLFGFFLAEIFFSHYVFSTWCFFAAIISLSIFFIIKSLNSEKEKNYEYRHQSSSL